MCRPIHFILLSCSKNVADSGVLLWNLARCGIDFPSTSIIFATLEMNSFAPETRY